MQVQSPIAATPRRSPSRRLTTAADFQSPLPTSVIVFEEGGVLTVHEISRDGQLLFTRADTGRETDNLTEVTCSFTTGSQGTFTVTGILTAR